MTLRSVQDTVGNANNGDSNSIDMVQTPKWVTVRNGVNVVAVRDPHEAQYFSPIDTFSKNFNGTVVIPAKSLE